VGLSCRSAAEKAIKAVYDLTGDIGLAKGLSELGMKEELIPHFSSNAMKDACFITNPRDAGDNDIAQIYRMAM